MADKFDPYREALVMEEETVWPVEFNEVAEEDRSRLERKLHDSAEKAALLDYVRTHTGFRRRITVTGEDYARIS